MNTRPTVCTPNGMLWQCFTNSTTKYSVVHKLEYTEDIPQLTRWNLWLKKQEGRFVSMGPGPILLSHRHRRCWEKDAVHTLTVPCVRLNRLREIKRQSNISWVTITSSFLRSLAICGLCIKIARDQWHNYEWMICILSNVYLPLHSMCVTYSWFLTTLSVAQITGAERRTTGWGIINSRGYGRMCWYHHSTCLDRLRKTTKYLKKDGWSLSRNLYQRWPQYEAGLFSTRPLVALMMEAVRGSENLVNFYQSTGRCNSEAGLLHCY
jgi:hypothetical protein